MENGACHAHGGKAAVGMANGQWKGKGYSKYLPAELLQDYEAALNDPERLSLQYEMALLRMQLQKVIAELRAGQTISDEVHEAARQVSAAYNAAHAANQAGDTGRFVQAMVRLGQARNDLQAALRPAAAQEATRQRAVQMTQAIERLTRSENQRIVELHGMVSLEAAMADRHALVSAVLEAIDGLVRDPETRAALRSRTASVYARLTGRRDAAALGPARGDEPARDAEYSSAED